MQVRGWSIAVLSCWLATALILGKEALVRADATRSFSQTIVPEAKNDGLVRVKLIPHHVHVDRLRRERKLRRLQHGEENSIDSYDDLDLEEALAAHKNRPDQYPRRLLQNEHRHLNEGDPVQVAELFQGYGTHYVDLWVGTPNPQRQTVIVDTGSGVTAFPCSGCNNCGVPKYHSDGLFDQKQSTTFRKLSCAECLRGDCSNRECKISMSYQEGSKWSAFESQDQCYAGGLHDSALEKDPSVVQDDLNPFLAAQFAFPLKFGCQISLTGLFITQLADGIMGLDNAKTSYVQQMRDSGTIRSNSFSLCYWRKDQIDTDGTESGSFTIGGTDDRLHNTPMVYTSMSSNHGFYPVHIRNMYLREGNSGTSALSTDPGAKVIPLGLTTQTYQRGQVIVDSGTTDTYFSRSVGTKFRQLFKEMSGMDFGKNEKMKMTIDQVRALPTILIQLEGDDEKNEKVREDAGGAPVPGLVGEIDPDHPNDVLLAMPPTHYMEYDPDDDVWTNRFYTSEPSGGVIGGNAMMGHDVYFNSEIGQVGWSESECDYTKLMAEYQFTPGVSPSRVENKQNTPSLRPTAAPVPTPPPQSLPIPVLPPTYDAVPVTDDLVITEEEPSQFCSTLPCQGAMISTVVLVVAVIALCALNRNKGPSYHLSAEAATELEMQDAAGNVGSDGIIRYRDEPGSKSP